MNGFGDTVTGYGCCSSCPCSKESRGQDRGQQGKGTFPRKVWACGVCCPEDVGSPSSPKQNPVRQMRAAPAVLDAPVPDAAVIPKVAIEKVSLALPPRGFVMVVHPPWQRPGKANAMPMAAGMEPPAGMPRGPASSTDGVPVKAMPPVPVLPAPPATAVTTTMVVEAAGLVTKSALHPPLPESVAIIDVPEAAEMDTLAPTISKASAAISMIEEIGDDGLDSPSSRSPITPPAMPLIAPGFPQPGTPASAFGAISAPGDPDDESPMLEVSDEG